MQVLVETLIKSYLAWGLSALVQHSDNPNDCEDGLRIYHEHQGHPLAEHMNAVAQRKTCDPSAHLDRAILIQGVGDANPPLLC